MDRLLTFWQKYRPEVDPAALSFLREVCQVVSYRKEEVIKLPHETHPYFFIVLHGQVGGFDRHEDNVPLLRELILTLDYFSGPAHPFTKTQRQIEYRALSSAILLRMTTDQAAHGQQHYPDIAELFHVMKQRKITQLRQQLLVYQQKDAYSRYVLYRTYFPDWAHKLSHRIQYQFLHISLAQYKRVKGRYLRSS